MPMKNFKVKAHVRVNPRTRVSETVQAESKSTVNQEGNALWFWLTLFFASAWVGTLVYFLFRKTGVADDKQQQLADEKVLVVKKALKQACTDNDPVMAKDILLQWGRENFKQSNLTRIAQQCDQGLQDEILLLNASLKLQLLFTWVGQWFKKMGN